uniref:T-box domain-containing protein n=1 Tax=Xiphophorus maculatus TaxID=8083 RepID=A0A3B5R122_XIPMA
MVVTCVILSLPLLTPFIVEHLPAGVITTRAATPANPAVTPPPILEQTFDQSPATSQIASAPDSLKSPGANLLSISDPPPWVPTLPPSAFGCQNPEGDFPVVLTFEGVSVTLENNSIWKQFCECGTEMILTKQGRRMFPYCRYRLAGLDPDRMYSLVLSIVPSSPFRYRWNTSRWEANGPTEHQSQGLIRAFPHHYSPCLGSDWMSCLVSFYKLKLTNCFQDQEGHMILPNQGCRLEVSGCLSATASFKPERPNQHTSFIACW